MSPSSIIAISCCVPVINSFATLIAQVALVRRYNHFSLWNRRHRCVEQVSYFPIVVNFTAPKLGKPTTTPFMLGSSLDIDYDKCSPFTESRRSLKSFVHQTETLAPLPTDQFPNYWNNISRESNTLNPDARSFCCQLTYDNDWRSLAPLLLRICQWDLPTHPPSSAQPPFLLACFLPKPITTPTTGNFRAVIATSFCVARGCECASRKYKNTCAAILGAT